VTIQKLEINDQFKKALHLMNNTSQSLFITGKAGTGKSTLLDYFCEKGKKQPAVLAPTGIAALNVNGQTIHRFFNFYIDVTPQRIKEKKTKPKNSKLYKNLKTIIIDEVSMLRADLLDCIDTFLKMYGPKPKTAFGGVQMIFVGDLYQLPPVVTSKEKNIFTNHYKTPYFFSAHALLNFEIEVIELEKVYRQKDHAFIELLNKIRNNSVETEDIAHLNSRNIKTNTLDKGKFYITLTTTNKKADEINETHLEKLDGKNFYSKAEISGDFGKEYYPTAIDLNFKIKAQIMLLNNDQKQRWVNGTIGSIESVEKDDEGEEYLRVKLQTNNRIVSVYPYAWEVYKFTFDGHAIISEPIGTFVQYPFRLAWAVTIHKSQGKTFDNLIIDIGTGTFVTGQMYVALSRCTSFEGIFLQIPIKKHNIRTDYRIFDFLTRHQYRKSEQELSLNDKIDLIKKTINKNNQLEITYLKANDTKSKRIIIPLQVGTESYRGKEFQGIKAFCTKRQEERVFRVDRILKIKEIVSSDE
jgi:ATP-dependent exoDNAse (exonuclease V) alpha subunit